MEALLVTEQVIDVTKVEAYIKKNSALWIKEELKNMREALGVAPTSATFQGRQTILPKQLTPEENAAIEAFNSWTEPSE